MSALTMPRGLLSCRSWPLCKRDRYRIPGDRPSSSAANSAGLRTCRAQSVGQRAFEPIADLDPHLVLDRRDQQQHAVILLRFAELPEAKKLIGVGFDVAALQ
jgi:hypothetical protein